MILKDKMKKTIAADFSKDKNFDKINQKIKNNNNYHVLRYAIILLIIGGISLSTMLFKKQNELAMNSSDILLDEDIKIHVYDILDEDIISNDIDLKIVNTNIEKLYDYTFYKDMILPNFKISKLNAIYVKGKNKEYNKLNNYVLSFTSETKQTIDIAFSKTFKPLKDYYFKIESSDLSKIYNTELMLYHYKEKYIAIFNYDNTNYDIETNNLSYTDFIFLLKQIIKK